MAGYLKLVASPLNLKNCRAVPMWCSVLDELCPVILGMPCSRSYTGLPSCPSVFLSKEGEVSSQLGVKDASHILQQCAKRKSKVRAEQGRESVGRWKEEKKWWDTSCLDWASNLFGFSWKPIHLYPNSIPFLRAGLATGHIPSVFLGGF